MLLSQVKIGNSASIFFKGYSDGFNGSIIYPRIVGRVNNKIDENRIESKSESILGRISAGDRDAVQECLTKYSGLVWSLARRMLANKEEAEDAVQEIFIEIWKNAVKFEPSKASETTFVAMIARRRLIDRLRKSSREPNIDSFEDILVEPANRENEFLQTSIEAKQAAEMMGDLRPEQRKILHLSIVEGFSHGEIAKVLKLPLGTVKTHARRGLIEVRESLAAKGAGRGISA